MRPPRLAWVDAGRLAAADRRAADAFVGLADLDDEALAPSLALAPTDRDLADLRRPLAGPPAHFLKRRAFARALLGAVAGVAPARVAIGHDGAGAPRVLAPEGGWFVSVAARGALAAVAVAATPIGVDIEIIEPPREPVWAVLHRRERAGVEAAWGDGEDAPFRDAWVAKEAYLKARGVGLTRDPAAIEARFDAIGGFEIEDPMHPRETPCGIVETRAVGGTGARVAVAFAAFSPRP